MKKILFMFLIVAAGLSSCTKEGPAGKDGKDGVDGRDGNANVTSYEFTIYRNEWLFSNNVYVSIRDFTNVLTQDIAVNGTVLAYYKGSGISYLALPLTFTNGDYLNYAYEPNKVTFYTNSQPTGDADFKVVIIAGNPPSSININDYNDVANYYGLDNN